MKLAINIALSLAMLGLCVWLFWPSDTELIRLKLQLQRLSLAEFWPHLAGYLGLLAITHFCRAWRWNCLLRPIGVELKPGPLLAISSVGFMAILALPARLGEFVRPALIRRKGKVSAAAALGSVAVERIVDGLLVSVFVFVTFFALRNGEYAKPWMMPVAFGTLALFSAALVFLIFALRWPDKTVWFAVVLTGSPWYAPRIARFLHEKVASMISGFVSIKDRRNLIIFLLWSILYWGANGLSFYVLASGMGIELTILGAFATTGLIAVAITLPNSPGLVAQFHGAVLLGMSLFMPLPNDSDEKALVLAFAFVLHGIQVIWYVGIGILSLLTPWVSFSEIRAPSDAPPKTCETDRSHA